MSTTAVTSSFYLSMGALSADSTAQVTPSFDQLPSSDYKDGGYRLRRYSRFHFADQTVTLLEAKPFKQSGDINEFQGNVERRYEDIEASCYASEGFRNMFATYYRETGLPDEATVEVHQMRIVCQGGETVETAPEGVHQDGFRRLGVFFLRQSNITGGEMKVYPAKDAQPIVTKSFAEGEYVIIDDARFWHHTNPITPIDKNQIAFYDVFVITGDKL